MNLDNLFSKSIFICCLYANMFNRSKTKQTILVIRTFINYDKNFTAI